jgi:ring-1,2-phenylacetyl-CoA epoxidase subunit PaaC
MSMIQTEQLAKELTYMADDEWVIGSFLAEMSGGGPFVEENVAISSIAQDEIGHAELLYNEVLKISPSLHWNDADGFVYTRSDSEFRPSVLVSTKNTEWAMICIQHYLYECSDRYRMSKLIQLVDGKFKDVLRQILREETYHDRHWATWVQKMTLTSDGKTRFQESINLLWPKFLAVFTDTFLENDQELFNLVEKELTSLGYDTPAIKKAAFPRDVLSVDVKRLINESRFLTEGGVGTKW